MDRDAICLWCIIPSIFIIKRDILVLMDDIL